MNRFFIKIQAYRSLGFANLFRGFVYRIKIKLGFVDCGTEKTIVAPFFADYEGEIVNLDHPDTWQCSALWFGWYAFPLKDNYPPDWYFNPIDKIKMEDRMSQLHWSKISDFDSGIGDIKIVWELSRFEWVLSFAQEAKKGNLQSIAKLNDWLSDWCQKCQPYDGPNWKCGQEASIRVIHLAFAALILEQVHNAEPGLINLIKAHLKRIGATMSYAIAQDNNHGTSEAAALYIGGSWLSLLGKSEGRKWQRIGAKWLVNRAMRLVMRDGSFSQYSVNYHRVILDTFSAVEVWRKNLGLPVFPLYYMQRIKMAANWLFVMVQQKTGDAPNIGANDGARLLPLSPTDYRDYRPSVQLAMVLFSNRRAYKDNGLWNLPLDWLGIAIPGEVKSELGSCCFDEGGFAVLKKNNVMAVLRFPKFKFRPGHADALHVDFWKDGVNLLRDAGTYSYNSTQECLNYFSGVQSHNTIQFDDHDQMPRVSRFLFGSWLKTKNLAFINSMSGDVSVSAQYKDPWGGTHIRQVVLSNSCMRVVDTIDGFEKKAVLRWRLRPQNWRLTGHCLSCGEERILIHADVDIVRIDLIEGWESRYYWQKERVPVLEIEVMRPTALQTEYHFSA